jgi:DNA-binding NarL/FixJ family response regulator
VLTNKPVRGQRLVDGIAGLGLPYVVRLRAPATMGELDEAIHTHGARLILLDVDFASHLGPQALLQVSRGHPLVHWVLVWDALQVQDDKLLKCTGASGCLEWRSDAQTVMRCIAAVTAGDLWLPRRMLRLMIASHHKGLRPSDLEAAASDEAGESLTGREREALELVGQGLTNKHIALRLGISVNTVKKHLKQVFKKRGFNSRRQLFA